MHTIQFYRQLAVSVLFLSSAVVAARGQVVIATGAGGSASTNATAGYPSLGQSPKPAPSSLGSAFPQTGPLFQFGGVSFRPHASYEVVSSSGIPSAPGLSEKTTSQTFIAGLSLSAGSRTTGDYSISRVKYSTASLREATNQSVSVQSGMTTNNWNLGVSGSYSTSTNVLVEVATQAAVESYSTGLTVSHPLNSENELEASLSRSVRSATPVVGIATWKGSDLTQWSFSSWWRNHVSRGLSVAAGLGAGYDAVANSPDITTTRPQVQMHWRPTQRISLSAEYGFEWRKTSGTSVPTESNSRYSASLTYHPFSATTLTAGASKSVDPSYFDKQTSQTTGVTLGLQQRLLKRFYFTAFGLQNRSKYMPTVSGIPSDRGDRYDTYRANLSTPVFGRGSVAVFYQRSRNHSNSALYAFKSNQVGASINYQF